MSDIDTDSPFESTEDLSVDVQANSPPLTESSGEEDDVLVPTRFQLPGFDLPVNYTPNLTFMFPNATNIKETKHNSGWYADIITHKPDWDKKIFNDEIVTKWKTEALSDNSQDITPAMDGMSDIAVRHELKSLLRKAVKPLEDILEKDKDWHPGSDGKVLVLVHPSLFPLIYGRTRILEESLTNLEDCVKRCGEGKITAISEKKDIEQTFSWWNFGEPPRYTPYSARFQWLPCEVDIGMDNQGKIKSKITSYINNLHPDRHARLYQVIESVISCAIPLWNRTLTPLKHPWRDIPSPRIPYEKVKYEADYDSNDEEVYYWEEARFGSVVVPDAPQWKDPKLANIHLTPEKPEYGGGTWHVEGQLNEHICATALYYYDITPSHLAFRHQADAGYLSAVSYRQNHDLETREGRLLTFPNILQHQVQPFKLADPTNPGHRKILALLLLDPNIRIISRANVPCQRKDWWEDEIRQNGISFKARDGAVKDLPAELQDLIFDDVDEFPVSMNEAKESRLELIEERKNFVLLSNDAYMTRQISLCEH
ncbi:hypothetical protein AX16_006953 [Volvariella volvacea WC 439]|nr:hypothetical protein AX16_006953 [Volvariella volvacea WC 439]